MNLRGNSNDNIWAIVVISWFVYLNKIVQFALPSGLIATGEEQREG